MEKRGQAAMEFLMTYGWAILAAVIAIGVLAYFGVFSPSKYLPDICTINAPLGCEEHLINTTSVRMIIRNGAGDDINIYSIAVANCATDTTTYSVADGATEDVAIDCDSDLSGKFSGDITVIYLKSGAVINQTATGTITAEVS